MKWQKVSKILAGLSSVGVVGMLSYLFLLTGMEYPHSGDSNCTYVDGIYQCEAFINISTKYWNFEFEHLNPESYIYLPSDLKTFTGKLTRYQAGDLDFVPVLYKKSTYGRKLWVNLDKVENIIATQPSIKVDWMVPARGKDNWRPVKEGDTWDRLKNNRIKLIGYPESEFETIKWSFVIGEVDIDPIWYSGVKYNTKRKTINGKEAVEIKFNIQKDYNIKEKAEKKNKKPDELLNLKKTKYHGDVDIKLMHYVNVTTNQSYSCNCHNETIEYPANLTNVTEAYNITNWVCDTCYKNITTEVFQEIDPETFILKNNKPIYEVFGDAIQFEELPDGGWGYSVWTDITIMGVEVENATWANATFARRKPVEVDNNDLEVSNYSFKWIVEYDSDMQNNFADLMFANSTDTSLSYWIEEKYDGVNATVWVKDPNLLVNSTNTTHYMYYDNTSVVSTESDSQNTFSVYDDFADGDYTSNPTWTVNTGTWTAASYYLDNNAIGTIYVPHITMSERNYEFRFKLKSPTGYNTVAFFGTDYTLSSPQNRPKDCYELVVNPSADTIFRRRVGGSTTNIDTFATVGSGWADYRITMNHDNNITIYRDDVQMTSAIDANIAVGSTRFFFAAGSTNDEYDNVRIMRYLETTPTYSFGAEETTTVITLNSPDSETTTSDNTPDFNFTISSDNDIYICDVFLNDTGYGRDSSVTNNTPTIITANATVPNGDYNWHVACTNYGSSETRIITIATEILITVHSPTDGSTVSVDSPEFNYTVIGSFAKYNCEGFFNTTGTGNLFTNNNTDTTTGFTYNFDDGIYDVYMNCSNGTISNVSTTISVRIDVLSSFNVTESPGTALYFYAYKPIQTEIEPYGQTSTKGMFHLDNNLTYTIDIYAKLNETTTGVTLKLNDEYSYSDAISITTSNQLIYSDLAVDATGYIWAWADFDNLLTPWNPKIDIVRVAS